MNEYLKTIFVNHRINNVEDLLNTPSHFGCEIDIRNHGEYLIVTHDPFSQNGPRLEKFLELYRHRFLIVNVKEEGLGEKISHILRAFHIENYFILDESFPFIFKYAMNGHSEFACRVSEFENYNSAVELQKFLKQKNRCIDWVWLDNFTGKHLLKNEIRKLQRQQLQCCFVSPELHHLNQPNLWDGLIERFYEYLIGNMIVPDMICTKKPELWRELFDKSG